MNRKRDYRRNRINYRENAEGRKKAEENTKS
jgi:hypothetical protein